MVALPEYASREGCGVEVQDSRDEGSREFGRLVIHSFHVGIALWTLSFWVRACGMYIGISFLGVPQTDDDSESDRKAKRSSGARGRFGGAGAPSTPLSIITKTTAKTITTDYMRVRSC